jgi:peptide/nickel transport system permease protein
MPLVNAWRILSRNKLTLVGGVVVVVLAVIALVPEALAPYPPSRLDLAARLSPPSLLHWFGTDDFGRDIYSRVLHGARLSLFLSLAIVFVSLLVGAAFGITAAYLGGWGDELLMRFTDVVLAFPPILLAMVIVTTLQRSLLNVALTLVLISWPEYARVMRSQTLVIQRLDYIAAARSVGASASRIMWRHILPNSFAALVVQASLNLGVTILSLAALGFLGLGAQSPTPEWGLMISEGRAYFLDAWWFPVFPGFAIALTTLAFSFLGDGLRDIFDPRSRSL